jgi:hypothetical protein
MEMFEKKNIFFRLTVTQTVLQILSPCKRYSTASYSNNSEKILLIHIVLMLGHKINKRENGK